MARDKGFHDYIILDILGDIPGITSKSMFGGWGIFLNGKMFGIIFEGELYFKISEEDIKEFEKLGSRPFVYKRAGKDIQLGYWLVPEEVLEDRSRIKNLMFEYR